MAHFIPSRTLENQSKNLKRCLFCGGKAKLCQVGNSYNCSAVCPECHTESGVYGSARGAVAAWNRRVCHE